MVRPSSSANTTLTHGHIAKFTVSVRGFTASEEDLVCLDLRVDFMKSPSLE